GFGRDRFWQVVPRRAIERSQDRDMFGGEISPGLECIDDRIGEYGCIVCLFGHRYVAEHEVLGCENLGYFRLFKMLIGIEDTLPIFFAHLSALVPQTLTHSGP